MQERFGTVEHIDILSNRLIEEFKEISPSIEIRVVEGVVWVSIPERTLESLRKQCAAESTRFTLEGQDELVVINRMKKMIIDIALRLQLSTQISDSRIKLADFQGSGGNEKCLVFSVFIT